MALPRGFSISHICGIFHIEQSAHFCLLCATFLPWRAKKMKNGVKLEPLSGLHEAVRYGKGDELGVMGILTRRDEGSILLVHHEPSDSWRLPFGFFMPGDGNWVQAAMRMVPRTLVTTADYIDLRMKALGLAREVSRLKQVAVAVGEVSPGSLARFPTQRHSWVKSEEEFTKLCLGSPTPSAMKLLVAAAIEKGAFFKQAQGAIAH